MKSFIGVSSSKQLVPILMNLQSRGVTTQKEDLQFACIPKSSIKKLSLVDFPEVSQTDSSAETKIDFNILNQKCPTEKNYRIAVHSHTHTNSLLTAQDIQTGHELTQFNINGICASGTNGYECMLFQTNNQAYYVKKTWTSSQLKQLFKSYPSIKISNLVCAEQPDYTYSCLGQYLGSEHNIPIGVFNSIGFIGKNVEMERSSQLSYVIGVPMKKAALHCSIIPIPLLTSKQQGLKLVC